MIDPSRLWYCRSLARLFDLPAEAAMIPPFIFLPAVLGLLFGSFANVCIHRMPIEETVLRGRSHCPHCRKLIAWYDNIPVLSWLILLGRCRACRGPISAAYVLVELVSGAAFFAAFVSYRGAAAVAAAALLWALIVVFWVDLRHRIIPNEISIGFAVAGLVAAGLAGVNLDAPFAGRTFAVVDWDGIAGPGRAALARSISGLLVGGGLIAVIRVAGEMWYKQEAMGMGDVKLMACVGAWLGPGAALYTLFYGSLIGGVISLGLLALGRARMKSQIPFGPFLVAGAVIAMFSGGFIIDLVVNPQPAVFELEL